MGLGDISLAAQSYGPQRRSFKPRGRVDQTIAHDRRWRNTLTLTVDRPDAIAGLRVEPLDAVAPGADELTAVVNENRRDVTDA